jgi:hypothetical protein
MQPSFRDLRVPGELRCGGAHDVLTTRMRFCASRLTYVTVGEESPSGGSGKMALTFLGGNASEREC